MDFRYYDFGELVFQKNIFQEVKPEPLLTYMQINTNTVISEAKGRNLSLGKSQAKNSG